jgi:hypothetical protein
MADAPRSIDQYLAYCREIVQARVAEIDAEKRVRSWHADRAEGN